MQINSRQSWWRLPGESEYHKHENSSREIRITTLSTVLTSWFVYNIRRDTVRGFGDLYSCKTTKDETRARIRRYLRRDAASRDLSRHFDLVLLF